MLPSINLLSLHTPMRSSEVQSVIFSISQMEKLSHQQLPFRTFSQSGNEAKDKNSGQKGLLANEIMLIF